MSKAGFGEHLKREREMRGVSLDEICAATRISTRFLEALESEEWERLPGGIFNRGFVRAVARYLGLDEEGFVAEYAMALSEGTPASEYPTVQPARQEQATHWLPWVGVAALILLAGAGWFAWHRHTLRRAQRATELPASETIAAPEPAAAFPGSAPVTGSDAATPTAAPTSSALQLKVEAGKPTALTISADGSTAFAGWMDAGQSRVFSAQSDFDVSARDAGALLLELNGRTLAPIGPPGLPGRVMLTRRDLAEAAGGND